MIPQVLSAGNGPKFFVSKSIEIANPRPSSGTLPENVWVAQKSTWISVPRCLQEKDFDIQCMVVLPLEMDNNSYNGSCRLSFETPLYMNISPIKRLDPGIACGTFNIK